MNVALVLNTKTGLVSPQFHVVFDDDFTTVPHLRKGTVPPNWIKLIIGSQEKSTDEVFDLTKTWFQPTNDESADEIFSSRPTVNQGADQISSPVTQVSNGYNLPTTAQASEGDSYTNSLLMPEMVNLEASGLRCSNRIASQGKKSYNFFSGISRFCDFGGLLAMSLTQPTAACSHGCASVNAVIHQCNIINSNFDGSLNELHHMELAVGKSNNENYTFREMIKEDDASDFIKAMEKEIHYHESRGHWEVIKGSEIPRETKTIQAI